MEISSVIVDKMMGGCGRRVLQRLFHTSLRRLEQQNDIPLALDPSKWKGLPSEEIFKLFKQRFQILGPKYYKSKDELEALLSTSKDSGFTYDQIRKIYENGDQLADTIEKNVTNEIDGMVNNNVFDYDDYTTYAHILVDEHREQREFNRIAAYEMPLLLKFRQPYERKELSQFPIRYRFTTYIGEQHPLERKVVATLKVSDLKLDDKQSHKFKLLSGVRYNYMTDEFKISCERYPEPAQNARFISDTLNRLVKEAKDLKDDFSDVPLDTRHIKLKLFKKKQARKDVEFPEEWKRPQDAPVHKLVPEYLLE